MYLSLSWSLCLSLSLYFLLVTSCLLINLSKCLKDHKSLRWRCSLKVFVFVFFGQVMFFYYTDQMSQRSQISKIALWRCSLNVFVFFVGQVMFSHQSEQISQRSQVCSKIKRGAGLYSINWVTNHKFVLHASHPLRLPSLLLPCFFRLVSTWVLLK